jgi:hypothetical protein
MAETAEQQVTVLSQVLASEVNIGYEDMINMQVCVCGGGGACCGGCCWFVCPELWLLLQDWAGGGPYRRTVDGVAGLRLQQLLLLHACCSCRRVHQAPVRPSCRALLSRAARMCTQGGAAVMISNKKTL